MTFMTSATIFGLSGWFRRDVAALSNLRFFCCLRLASESSAGPESWRSDQDRRLSKGRDASWSRRTESIDRDQDQSVESSVHERGQARQVMRMLVAEPTSDELVPRGKRG